MEDKKSTPSAGKPGKAPNEVMAGLRKIPAVQNLAGNKGPKLRRGTNRGTVSGSNPKHSPHIGVKK
jgi:hypothetical protein